MIEQGFEAASSELTPRQRFYRIWDNVSTHSPDEQGTALGIDGKISTGRYTSPEGDSQPVLIRTLEIPLDMSRLQPAIHEIEVAFLGNGQVLCLSSQDVVGTKIGQMNAQMLNYLEATLPLIEHAV